MRIAYIGLKPTKTDNVAGTGLTWVAGQEHEVANLGACAKLLRHADVWAVAGVEAPPAVPETPETGTDDTNKPTETVPELDALRARLTDLGIKFHHKAGIDKLQALLPKD